MSFGGFYKVYRSYSSIRSYRSSQNPFNFSFFGISSWGMDNCDVEWFALQTEIILLFLRLHQLLHFGLFC